MGWQLIWRRLQTSSRWRSRFFRGTIAFLICLTSHRSFALANRRTVCPLQAVGSVGSDAEAATKFALGVEMLMESAAKMSSQGEHEKALGALASAEELLEAAGSPDNLAAGYFMQRGATFAHLKRFGETLQEFGRARDIFKKHNDMKNPEIVTVSGNMAIAASAIGRRKDAMLFFNEASEILDALGDDQMKAYILSSMGAACVGAGAFEQGFSHMKQAQKVAVAGQTICKHSQWTFTTIRQNVSRLCKKLTAQKRTETIRVFFIPHVSHVRCEPHCIVSIDVFDLTWEGCQDCFHQQTFKTEFHDLTPLSSGLPYRTAFTIPHDVSAGSHTNAVGNQFRHFMFRTKSIMLHETSGSKQMTSSMGDIVLNQGAAQSWFG
ncbi:unnamed protein product [Durusdinium trenchii]|uniref:Uncharacterized protein n=1 Tax=Durusdinium trenchii TaxID=1381693 RepID=A0ABP0SIU8_9DINO